MDFYKQGCEDALIKLGFGKALGRAWGELAPRSQAMLKQYGMGAGAGGTVGAAGGAMAAPEGQGLQGALGGALLGMGGGAMGGRALGKHMQRAATKETGALARETGGKEYARLVAEGTPEAMAKKMVKSDVGGQASAELSRIQGSAFPSARPVNTKNLSQY